MRAGIAICCFLPLVPATCRTQENAGLKALYESHKWSELYQQLQSTKGVSLYRGAIGVTFNQDRRNSESLLLSVIRSASHSPEAYEAYEWLSHLYFYSGQYRSLVSIMERGGQSFPKRRKERRSNVLSPVFVGCQTKSSKRLPPPRSITRPEVFSFLCLSVAAQQLTFSIPGHGCLV
jgi:hypothetical protein